MAYNSMLCIVEQFVLSYAGEHYRGTLGDKMCNGNGSQTAKLVQTVLVKGKLVAGNTSA